MKSSHLIPAIFLLFLLISLSSNAQVGELRNNLSIGFNGGVNLNNVSFAPTSIKQKGLMGFGGGFTMRYISEKYFAMICGIQIELNYTQRGWEEEIENSTDTYSRNMNYLEIPFLAHLAFGRERGARAFINLGPQFSFLLNEKENFSNSWDPSNRLSDQYNKKAERMFDYGIMGGLGLEIRTGAGNFLLEGRYYFGLADFFNNSKKDPFSRSAHSVIMGRLTYLFDLKK
ncbi:MAG: PorT family protein [Bacteroides sp.]|nr:PorT family protein [Bacteroides sp.]